MSKNNENLGVRGFFRAQIEDADTGRIVGDSGWRENQVLNLGIEQYILTWLVNGVGGKSVSHMAIGTGAAPASAATTLPGEANEARASVAGSIVSSRTARFVAAFNSADSFVTNTQNIANVGLVNTATVGAGTFIAGASFASSAIATNNNLNITYELRFQ